MERVVLEVEGEVNEEEYALVVLVEVITLRKRKGGSESCRVERSDNGKEYVAVNVSSVDNSNRSGSPPSQGRIQGSVKKTMALFVETKSISGAYVEVGPQVVVMELKVGKRSCSSCGCRLGRKCMESYPKLTSMLHALEADSDLCIVSSDSWWLRSRVW
eukprot:5428037-Amphidinium_carterae.1